MFVAQKGKAKRMLVAKLQRTFSKTISGARITVKEFQRGPSVGTPVQLRIYGADLQVLRELSKKIKQKLRDIPDKALCPSQTTSCLTLTSQPDTNPPGTHHPLTADS